MAEIHALGPAAPGNRMLKLTAFLFGAVAYLTFLFTILYAIGFVEGLVVPKDIDTGAKSPVFEALAINLALMSLFAVQHSVMARNSFKQWWTRFIPKPVERSTYVLLASLVLLLLFWQWRPMPAVIWHIEEPEMAAVITGVSFVGWVIVFTSTYLINHFELFGLHPGGQPSHRAGDVAAGVPDAAALQLRAASDLPRLHHRLLGGADDDRRDTCCLRR